MEKASLNRSSNRSFGMVFTLFFAIIGLWPLLAHRQSPHWWALGIGAGIFLLALLVPSMLAIPNRLWMRFGELLHRIVTPITLGFIFFLVITPFAIAMRLAGRDSLRLKFDNALPSYWVKREPAGPSGESMTRQF